MANQPEVTNYDAGVYQLGTTDPVQGGVGGVSNAPLLNLANRTNWLYTNLNLVISGGTVPTGLAVLNSPAFTGTPTAPTPSLGDNSTKIATTAFVQGTVSGLLSLSVAGNTNVNLNAIQAGNGIFNFTGALTGNIAVIVPGSNGKWVVENNTTGAFSLTVKTAAGTGIAVTQGKSQALVCDGTNVIAATNDFANMALTGIPTAPTAAVDTNTSQLATTAFVIGQSYAKLSSPALVGTPTAPTAAVGTNTTQVATMAALQAANQGSLAIVATAGGTADALTGTFSPAVTALTAGMTFLVRAASANATTTPTFAANGTAAKTIVKVNNQAVQPGDISGAGHWLELTYDLTLDKYVLANPALLASFGSSVAGNGWQKLPTGLIIQWGSVAGGTSVSVTFPISFVTSVFVVSVFDGGYQVSQSQFGTNSITKTGFTARSNSTGEGMNYIAIGT